MSVLKYKESPTSEWKTVKNRNSGTIYENNAIKQVYNTAYLSSNVQKSDVASGEEIAGLLNLTGKVASAQSVRALNQSLSGAVKYVKLWENQEPSSIFYAQTIACNLSGYSHCAIEYRWHTSTDLYTFATPTRVGKKGRLILITDSTTANVNTAYRQYTVNTDGVDFEGVIRGTGTQTESSTCVPVAIYGVNLLSSSALSEVANETETIVRFVSNDGFEWDANSYRFRKPYTIPTGYDIDSIVCFPTNGAAVCGAYVAGGYIYLYGFTPVDGQPISTAYVLRCTLKLRKV